MPPVLLGLKSISRNSRELHKHKTLPCQLKFPFWLAPLETEIEPVYKYNQGFLMRYRTPEVPSSSLSSQISKNSQESGLKTKAFWATVPLITPRESLGALVYLTKASIFTIQGDFPMSTNLSDDKDQITTICQESHHILNKHLTRSRQAIPHHSDSWNNMWVFWEVCIGTCWWEQVKFEEGWKTNT